MLLAKGVKVRSGTHTTGRVVSELVDVETMVTEGQPLDLACDLCLSTFGTLKIQKLYRDTGQNNQLDLLKWGGNDAGPTSNFMTPFTEPSSTQTAISFSIFSAVRPIQREEGRREGERESG